MTLLQNFSLELLTRYNQAGPRYTSYPTAPFFKKEFDTNAFQHEIKENQDCLNNPLSLYVHLPFCDTLCYFCGCTMLVTHDRQKISTYLTYLKKELTLMSTLISAKREVTQIHWGGGTPTYLNPFEIEQLGEWLQQFFPRWHSHIEAGCELDPRGLTFQHLKSLKNIGFNRLSMGVQDFDPVVQKAINRIQPAELTRQVIEWARELDFKDLNIDLIYGLPHQSLVTFEKTLEQIIQLNPDRIAVFNYAHVPWLKKHQKLIHEKDLPSVDERLKLLKLTIDNLQTAGYVYIGMDHFAKPENELTLAQRNKTLYRNFQGYSTHAEADVYAFGMSAISQLSGCYAQNAKTLPEYYQKLDQNTLATHAGYRLNLDDKIRRKVITRLMCDFELDEEAIEKEFSIHFTSYFEKSLKKLKPLIGDQLLFKEGRRWIMTETGRLLIRNIAMTFDAYLDQVSPQKTVFSKTI